MRHLLTWHWRTTCSSLHNTPSGPRFILSAVLATCRLKKCRQVAHSVNHLSGTVTGSVADMSIRVADGIVRRMGGSNYGQ